MPAHEKLYQLHSDFISTWSLDRLKRMTLEEYNNLDRSTSFCYWIETKTRPLGSIKGGSSYKFGIYKKSNFNKPTKANCQSDGEYAWFRKYGDSRESAFDQVRSIIVAIAVAASENNLAAIEEIDMGVAMKWKIAFLYSNFQVINIFKYEALKNAADFLDYAGKDVSYAALNTFIFNQKPPSEDYFTFTHRLWDDYENPTEDETDSDEHFYDYYMETRELNQIFFGPPGTGKTYETIEEAVKIVDPDFFEENKRDRIELKRRFNELLLKDDNIDNWQIAFTTFHQSFSYEDFVEGIKPVMSDEDANELGYKIVEGIFKKICRMASDNIDSTKNRLSHLISLSDAAFQQAQFYKMSLGNTQNEVDNEIYEYCIQNNCITIGYGNGEDFSRLDERQLKNFGQEKDLKSFDIQSLNLFKNYLKIGNYVIISDGNTYVRAIGKVTSEYYYEEIAPLPNHGTFNHFRKVEWVFTGKNIAASEIYNRNLQQQPIYKLDKKGINPAFFVREDTVHKAEQLTLNSPKNYVLIIDEINRGNVSAIFGELITLIEKDKRAGNGEELSVILPYSKKRFTVPNNVYIIGTMNTADRSVEALDTALRRRFSFKEISPNPKLIIKINDNEGIIEGGVNLVEILSKINNRIELLIDKDHKIGHSYFLHIDSIDKLKSVFQNKIIPLLEEYFFGDFGKIGLVLGDSFVEKKPSISTSLARFAAYDNNVQEDLLNREVFQIRDSSQWDFKSVYE
jgi:5-methylcytosine-specific restriction protein B